MGSRGGICLGAVVLALALPSAAQAAVRCVPASAPGCTTAHATIGAAVATAANDDTIQIAAGTYAEAITTTKRLNFVGAGSGALDSTAGATVIAPSSGTALTLQRGGSVSSLRAVGSSGFSGGSGLILQPDVDGTFNYALNDVIGLGGTGTDIIVGFGGYGVLTASLNPARVVNLSVSGGSFRGGSSVSFVSGPGIYLVGAGLTASLTGTAALGPPTGQALWVGSGANVTATASSTQGQVGAQVVDGTMTLRRTRVEGVTFGLAIFETATPPATSVSITDSLVLATPTGPVDAIAVSALTAPGSSPLTVPIVGSTIVARGNDPLYAVAARPPSGAPGATVDLRNSIARLAGGAEPGEADVAADRGVVTAAHSDFATSLALNGGTVPAPGSGTNLTADPLFDAGAFTLQGSSPLIDRGDPSLVAPGQLDLAGNPRADGPPDIGAYEHQRPVAPPPPPPAPPGNSAPALTKVSMTNSVFAPVGARASGRRKVVKRGTKFRYTLSEAATVTIAVERQARGRRVRGRCVKPTRGNAKRRACKRWIKVGTLRSAEQAGAQSIAFSGRFRRGPLAPGRYRARISAKDAAGARSAERRLGFRIVRAR